MLCGYIIEIYGVHRKFSDYNVSQRIRDSFNRQNAKALQCSNNAHVTKSDIRSSWFAAFTI